MDCFFWPAKNGGNRSFAPIFMARYAISDIHGCAETLRFLVEQHLRLSHHDELFVLGDFIDRGPDSAGVVRYLMRLQLAGYKLTVLRGNHEQLLLDALKGDHRVRNRWLAAGGEVALQSWRVTTVANIPHTHIHFLQNTRFYAETPGYVLFHAGLDFSLSNPLQGLHAMIWERLDRTEWGQKINHNWLNNRVLVHGHTPLSRTAIEQGVAELKRLPVLNIDAGCVYPREGLGNLCALNLDTRQLTFVPRMDVVASAKRL